MALDTLYATPRVVDRPDDCVFYHTLELPGYGVIAGDWDLRGGLRRYLGDYDFRGKRALDIGTATGQLAFFMERSGAREVVAFDLDEHQDWDVVPYATLDLAAKREEHRDLARRMNNAFWLAHRALGSSVKLVHGSVYHVPLAIGPVDVSVFGCVLQHVRDPFLALQNAARLTTETIIVTEYPLPEYWNGLRLRRWLDRLARVAPPVRYALRRLPKMEEAHFAPNPQTGLPPANWWLLSPEIVQRFLAVLGFTETTVSTHVQTHCGRPARCFTVVARRTHGAPEARADRPDGAPPRS
ncbi:MAG: class I SAM-dependent methyltransferase [Dehalococcoidia bacterium]|nr:class I SAM-dependent methyltransferase [Dehalococcoidia bacterium]